jgi:DNA-binding protein HU-beta
LEVCVNRRDLIGRIASNADLTRAQAAKALDAFIQGVQSSLLKGDRVTLSGFGSFAVSVRKARSVRDPRRGTPIQIAERRIPRFAPGVDFKAAMNPTDGTADPTEPPGLPHA